MRIYFAPLEGITTYQYRNLHHKYFGGVDKYFTPFLAPGPNQGLSVKEVKDALPENNRDIPLVPQILTNQAGDFLNAARVLGNYGYKEVNLNLGCPSGTVTAKRKGSGLLYYPEELLRLLDEVFADREVQNGNIEVSVKTRIGKNSPAEWPVLMEIYNRYPLKELIIHPRIQKDFYKNSPNLEVFAEALSQSRNPLVYNGDIFGEEDYRSFCARFPEVKTIMLGRGLIRNPALAEQLTGRADMAADCGAGRQPEKTVRREAGQQPKKTMRREDGQQPEKTVRREDGQQPEKTVQPGELTQGGGKARLRAFHDELLAQYCEAMSGDRNVLFKMKELWSYLIFSFPESGKLEKKIRKAARLAEYRSLVDELFGGP